jgi:DNA repair exonuclease SbcCD ATPase subunit
MMGEHDEFVESSKDLPAHGPESEAEEAPLEAVEEAEATQSPVLGAEPEPENVEAEEEPDHVTESESEAEDVAAGSEPNQALPRADETQAEEEAAPEAEPEDVVAEEVQPAMPPAGELQPAMPPAGELEPEAGAEEIRVEEPEFPPLEVAPPDRGGCWRLLAVGLVSALAGTFLALFILLVINGTLNYQLATQRALQAEAQRLDSEIGALSSDLELLDGYVEALRDLPAQVDKAQAATQDLEDDLADVQADLERIGTDVAAVQAEQERQGRELAAAQMALTMLRDDVDRVEDNVLTLRIHLGALEDQLGALSDELRAVRQATQRFDAFLGGLRQLLGESLEPATPAAAVTTIPLATPGAHLATPTPAP